MRKAKVFISCGQSKPREKSIGNSVAKILNESGFEAYFAERVTSLTALTEHIFENLRSSEYFISIDFKRDLLEKNGVFRGSLFVNQEIAIAAFLKIPGIGFYEKGVKCEGVVRYQIYNPKEFEDGTQIIGFLKDEIKEWDLNSLNELSLNLKQSPNSKNVRVNDLQGNHIYSADYWHLKITNRHNSKHAFTCLGYVTKIIDLNSKEEKYIPSIELKWAGISAYSVNIMAGTSRDLDAFHIIHGPNKLVFSQRPDIDTSNPDYALPVLDPGKYSIEYTIVSNNFRVSSFTAILDFQDGNNITLG